jgi:hypothetical protein
MNPSPFGSLVLLLKTKKTRKRKGIEQKLSGGNARQSANTISLISVEELSEKLKTNALATFA